MIETLTPASSALLVIDVQERLFPYIEGKEAILAKMQKAIKGFACLNIPIFVSEQVPAKMGPTLAELHSCFPAGQKIVHKSAFSAMDSSFLSVKHLILLGIETHVCVLQTARDLLNAGRGVTVLSDAAGSRAKIDYLSALNEMQQFGARLSTVETVLFELLKTAESEAFREIKDIIK